MNTLFDENAACHVALGQAYSTCLKNGDNLTEEQLAARGANSSLIHVDWMIGSNQIDVDGVSAMGDLEPVMRAGAGSRVRLCCRRAGKNTSPEPIRVWWKLPAIRSLNRIKSLEAAFGEDRDARETLKSLKIPGCTQLNLSRIG